MNRINNKNFIDKLKNILDEHVDILIKLYNLSEIENTKDERLNPNIGVNRELDFVAFLYYFMPIKSITYYISNQYPYDVLISGKKFSIKHQSGNSNSSIKVRWGTIKTNEYIQNFKKFNYSIIIISINREKQTIYDKTLLIYIMFEDDINELYNNFKLNNKTTFTIDQRGINFSSNFMKKIKENSVIITKKSDLLKTLSTEVKSLDGRLELIKNIC